MMLKGLFSEGLNIPVLANKHTTKKPYAVKKYQVIKKLSKSESFFVYKIMYYVASSIKFVFA